MERIPKLIYALILLIPACNNSAPLPSKNEAVELSLLEEHNKYRIQHKLMPLVLNKKLCEYAQKHAEIMCKKDYLFHSSMNKLMPVIDSNTVAENIAWGQETEEEVTKTWMNSWGHKANILGKDFKQMGFGVKATDKGVKYWCVVFSN